MTRNSSIANVLNEAAHRLAAVCDTPRLDAEALLGFVLDRNRVHLHTWPDLLLPDEAMTRFDALIARRATGEPLAYLTGRREFWSMELEVSPATLIPRPETELLVELALQRIPAGSAWRIADLGTGSGAIALAIARERPACRIVATDRSAAALAVARRNAARLGIGNVEFREGIWLEPLAGEVFDLIVSNPPYIASEDPRLHTSEIRFEPITALAAGPGGLDDIRHIAAAASHHLAPGGGLLLEHGYDQSAAVARILTQSGYKEVHTHQDMSGIFRVTSGSRP
ncbi:MAG: peptide chain release factor N(5)-glutamine methyltransferase [Pseudomonadota bacterium]